MSLAALPVELLHAVATHADLPALASLAATSSCLRLTADRLLYRHLDLSSSSRSLSAVLSLANRPTLASHVRTFALVVPAEYPALRAFAHALARALGAMSALVELRLTLDPTASWILDLLPSAASYPFLHTLSLSFPLDGPVARFLARTPAITSLALSPAPEEDAPPHPVPFTTVPLLTHFAGALAAAEYLASTGRPLMSVHALDGDLSPARLAGLAPLVVLAASTRGPLVPFLHALAKHAPALAYLRLTAPLPLASDATFPDISFYEDVAGALDALPGLVDFELAGMHWPSHVDAEQPSPKRVWHSAPSTPRPTSPLPVVVEVQEQEEEESEGDLYADLAVLF